jgi:hypothetical protein
MHAMRCVNRVKSILHIFEGFHTQRRNFLEKPTKGISGSAKKEFFFTIRHPEAFYSTSAVGDFLERVYANVFLFVKKVYGAGITILDYMLLVIQVIIMIQKV